MENYKLATQQKLRFQTTKGLLSTEQLWDLTLEDLDVLAVSLERESKRTEKKSFLDKTTVKDKTSKLKFEVALDILTSKVEEQEALTEAAEIKAHNNKIIELIAQKQDESLKGKSVKQLEALLR